MNHIQTAQQVVSRWQAGDLAEAVRNLSRSLAEFPAPTERFMKFEGFEVHPCIRFTEDDGTTYYYEQCEPDHPELFCWSLYGRIRPSYDPITKVHAGGLDCLVDFDKGDRGHQDAEYLCDLLNALLSDQ